MAANKSNKMFYDRRSDGGDPGESAEITVNFVDTLMDFGFNATHIMFEVVGAGSCDVGFGTAKVHAQLSNTSATELNPRVYENVGVGKIYLKGTSDDVKVTAWNIS